MKWALKHLIESWYQKWKQKVIYQVYWYLLKCNYGNKLNEPIYGDKEVSELASISSNEGQYQFIIVVVGAIRNSNKIDPNKSWSHFSKPDWRHISLKIYDFFGQRPNHRIAKKEDGA